MLNIIETILNWVGSLNLNNKPDTIIHHHAESTSCTVLDIDRWHKSRGWCGIGYQYFVRKDGSIFPVSEDAIVIKDSLGKITYRAIIYRI